jgi:hypothetical protein
MHRKRAKPVAKSATIKPAHTGVTATPFQGIEVAAQLAMPLSLITLDHRHPFQGI